MKAGPPKTVTISPRQWETGEPYEVTLIPLSTYGLREIHEWEVQKDGKTIGWVGRYTGSLDHNAGRLRVPGKRRTLWLLRDRPGSRGLYGYVSRADCIRQLVLEAERSVR